jgi:trigger factor
VKTTVERVDDTTVKLSITLDAGEVDAAVEQAARRLANEVKVPGFRPGKAPRKVLERRLGKDALMQEAVRGSLPGIYSRAVEAEELPVVSAPEFDVEGLEAGTQSTFTATVQVRPDVEVPDYRGLQIPHPEWEVTDEDVQAQLDALRERFATLETVRRAADAGSFVRMTVTGEASGERLEDASGEDLLYEVRDPAETDAPLDRNLIGTEAGAIVKFTDTLGEDYGERAGLEVQFTVIVKEVKVKRLRDLDDAFASEASEFDTIEELTAEMRSQLATAKRAQATAELRGKVVEAVGELVDVPLPEALVQEELRFRLQRLAHEAQHHDMSMEQYLQAVGQSADDLFGRLEGDARSTVKAQLVLDAVGRDAGIEIEREDLGVEIARRAQRLGQDAKELADYMTHPDRIGALVSDAFRRKTIDHLLEHVQVLSGPPRVEPVEDEDEDEAAGGAGG